MKRCPNCNKFIEEESNVGIFSPPFANSLNYHSKYNPNEWDFVKGRKQFNQHTGESIKYGNTEGNIGNLPYKDNKIVGVFSPPYQDSISGGHSGIEWQDEWGNPSNSRQPSQDIEYSNNPQNIGNLKDGGSIVGITSPPYVDSNHEYKDNEYQKKFIKIAEKKWGKNRVKSIMTKHIEGYRNAEGQIGNLKDTSNIVGITSPPFYEQKGGGKSTYENLGKTWNVEEVYSKRHKKYWGGSRTKESIQQRINERNIGEINNLGNKGKDLSENYLSAMLQIYKECAKTMPIIVTITKNPTRNGKLRRLDLDTAKLLELSGYEIIDYHRAILFRDIAQQTLTGTTKKEYKGRISFFKRLSLSKGNVASNFEDVIIAVRK